ncbi:MULTISPECIES: hypothetical protein [unclassified Streptomyces]|uniref:hypothetical protein n=1 Tax=unclassified Streptomyces TaxID=2593676 RepID=UPI00131D8865|nr:hypothetical protein [Streptomyces sp. NRRL S-118]
MTAAMLLDDAATADLSDFDLEIQLAVTGDLNGPLAPEAGFTNVTCPEGPVLTSGHYAVNQMMGPICCS